MSLGTRVAIAGAVIDHIENWSVALDLTLLVRTIPAVVFVRGAY